MKGKFIVVEGVNGVGKTTTLMRAVYDLSDVSAGSFQYSKGFTQDSNWDSFIHHHPHSFTYYLDLAMKTQTSIRHLLKNGQTIIQDRYVQTVDSYLPDCEWKHNILVRRLFDPLFLKPDLYIHVKADLETIVGRLKMSATDEYRLGLIDHPDRIVMREKKYMDIYDGLTCPKYIVDTTGRSVDDCASEVVEIMRRETRC
jgi:thymidylate kinase